MDVQPTLNLSLDGGNSGSLPSDLQRQTGGGRDLGLDFVDAHGNVLLEVFAGSDVIAEFAVQFERFLAVQELLDQLGQFVFLNWDNDLVDVVGAENDHACKS